MNNLLIVTADVNDADYITKNSFIEDDELDRLKKVVSAIKVRNDQIRTKGGSGRGNYNWMDSRDGRFKDFYPTLTDDDLDWFNDYLPWLDNEEIHTIESIELLEIASSIDYL